MSQEYSQSQSSQQWDYQPTQTEVAPPTYGNFDDDEPEAGSPSIHHTAGGLTPQNGDMMDGMTPGGEYFDDNAGMTPS